MITKLDTENYDITIRTIDNTWDREAGKKVRVYVEGETPVDFTEAYEMQKANEFAARGVNPDEDKLFNQLNRQVVKNKRIILNEAIEAVYELGELIDGAKFTFSKHAGCSSCPCSPGFIGNTSIRDLTSGKTITAIWIQPKAK